MLLKRTVEPGTKLLPVTVSVNPVVPAGVPVGADLGFADSATIAVAMNARHRMTRSLQFPTNFAYTLFASAMSSVPPMTARVVMLEVFTPTMTGPNTFSVLLGPMVMELVTVELVLTILRPLTLRLALLRSSFPAVAPLPNAQWEFVVFDDPKTANAFCLPGGKIGVYTGIFVITKDEAGLATVIGHEVSHAVARHGAERISEGLLLDLGGQMLDEAMKSKAEQTRSMVLAAPFETTPGSGAALGGATSFAPGKELPSVSLYDYWSPAASVWRSPEAIIRETRAA